VIAGLGLEEGEQLLKCAALGPGGDETEQHLN